MKKALLYESRETEKGFNDILLNLAISIVIFGIVYISTHSLESIIILFILLLYSYCKQFLPRRVCVLEESAVRLICIRGTVCKLLWKDMMAVGQISMPNRKKKIFFCSRSKEKIIHFFNQRQDYAKRICRKGQYEQLLGTEDGRWKLAVAVYLICREKKYEDTLILLPFKERYAKKIKVYYKDMLQIDFIT